MNPEWKPLVKIGEQEWLKERKRQGKTNSEPRQEKEQEKIKTEKDIEGSATRMLKLRTEKSKEDNEKTKQVVSKLVRNIFKNSRKDRRNIIKNITKNNSPMEKPKQATVEETTPEAIELEKRVADLTTGIDEMMEEENLDEQEEKIITKVAKVLKIEKIDLLKEGTTWLNNLVKFIVKANDQSYIEEINKNEGFDKEYFTKKYPYSLYGIADNIPFEIKIDLFRSGKIKDPDHIFTKEELEGDIGKIKIKEKTIAEWCNEQKERARKSFAGVLNAEDYAKKRNFETNNTSLGKIIIHDYFSLGNFQNGKNKINIIHNDLGYSATRANGGDTFVLFNKKDGYYSIRSRFSLKEIGKNFGVREEGDVFAISGPILNITEEEFLNKIDEKILARVKKDTTTEPVTTTGEPKEDKPEKIEENKQLEEKIDNLETSILELSKDLNMKSIDDLNIFTNFFEKMQNEAKTQVLIDLAKERLEVIQKIKESLGEQNQLKEKLKLP